MGNRVARLATPCFAAGDGRHAVDDGVVVHNNGVVGDDACSIGHILSFDGREGLAKGIGLHGVLLPSNQSTVGSSGGVSILNDDQMSLSGSSSFDSSNSFSFRTFQPGQYSGPLDSSASPSTSATISSMSVSRHGGRGPRTDEQILMDLAAVRHRRQCQASSGRSPILGGLRRAFASVLRGSPCASPRRGDSNDDGAGGFFTDGGGGIVSKDNATTSTRGAAARVQWARGKAGEDRVHVVLSEEHGWMFVGIYDGFNGPDATDYLVGHLYAAVCRELAGEAIFADDEDRDETLTPQEQRRRHDDVLDALARALQATEAGYMADAEARAAECPELAMMGSCVLVALIKGAHVYVMNVGDSRAVLAQQAEPEDMGGLGALQLSMDHSTGVYKVQDPWAYYSK
jgi:pyruvate dehydrogenase phosphatase